MEYLPKARRGHARPTHHADVHIAVQRIPSDDDQAVSEWQWQDTKVTTGLRHHTGDAVAFDFKDGLIVRWREHIDMRVLKT